MRTETTKFYPSGLIGRPNWIYWRMELDKKGNPTKVPYSPLYTGKAVVNKTSTWSSYTIAKANFKSYPISLNGLGFVFQKSLGYVFIDVDDCFDDNGNLTEIGKYALDLFKGLTYCEISQSGTGLHFVVVGKIPRGFKNSNAGVEMYFQDRYCAMTFNAICPVEPSEMQSELDEMFDKFKTEKKVKQKVTSEERPQSYVLYSDATVVEKACRSDRFRELYYLGNATKIYPSDSEADLFMCKELAFWTDADADAILRIVRSSCLYRDKWERADYQSNTISKAIASVPETVTDFVKRKEREKLNGLQEYLVSQERPY